MKKLFIVLGCLLVLAAAGGFIFFQSRRSTSKVAAASNRSITQEEVAKHSTASDCWMAIEGNVYDVTSFIPNHPGGQAIALGCGKDATALFNSRPNNGTSHSNRARDILSGMQIGVLAESS